MEDPSKEIVTLQEQVDELTRTLDGIAVQMQSQSVESGDDAQLSATIKQLRTEQREQTSKRDALNKRIRLLERRKAVLDKLVAPPPTTQRVVLLDNDPETVIDEINATNDALQTHTDFVQRVTCILFANDQLFKDRCTTAGEQERVQASDAWKRAQAIRADITKRITADSSVETMRRAFADLQRAEEAFTATMQELCEAPMPSWYTKVSTWLFRSKPLGETDSECYGVGRELVDARRIPSGSTNHLVVGKVLQAFEDRIAVVLRETVALQQSANDARDPLLNFAMFTRDWFAVVLFYWTLAAGAVTLAWYTNVLNTPWMLPAIEAIDVLYEFATTADGALQVTKLAAALSVCTALYGKRSVSWGVRLTYFFNAFARTLVLLSLVAPIRHMADRVLDGNQLLSTQAVANKLVNDLSTVYKVRQGVELAITANDPLMGSAMIADAYANVLPLARDLVREPVADETQQYLAKSVAVHPVERLQRAFLLERNQSALGDVFFIDFEQCAMTPVATGSLQVTTPEGRVRYEYQVPVGAPMSLRVYIDALNNKTIQASLVNQTKELFGNVGAQVFDRLPVKAQLAVSGLVYQLGMSPAQATTTFIRGIPTLVRQYPTAATTTAFALKIIGQVFGIPYVATGTGITMLVALLQAHEDADEPVPNYLRDQELLAITAE